MGTRFRWFLFCIFAILFATSGTVLIMVAQGYRYHYAKQRIEKTGEIFVDTKPKGATVTLGGQVATKKTETPTRISGLLSGQYTVRLEKEGFFPWTRTVSVSPGQSTLVRDVTLVRAGTVERIAGDEGIRFIGALSSGRIAIISATDVSEVDRESGRLRLLLRTSEKIRTVLPRPGGEGFLVETDLNTWVIDSQGVSTHLRLSGMPALAIRWSEDGSMPTGLSKGGFVLFSDGVYPVRILKGEVRSAVVDHGRISAIFEHKPSELFQYTLRGSEALPDGSISVTKPIRRILGLRGRRAVVEYGNSELGLVDTSSKQSIRTVVQGGENALFDSDQLVTWNDFELYVITLRDDGSHVSELLVRQSVPIAQVLLLSQLGYLAILSQDGSLRLIERSASGTQNRYVLNESEDRVKNAITLRSRDLVTLREEKGRFVVGLVQLSSQ